MKQGSCHARTRLVRGERNADKGRREAHDGIADLRRGEWHAIGMCNGGAYGSNGVHLPPMQRRR
jgi:hypothetical protein